MLTFLFNSDNLYSSKTDYTLTRENKTYFLYQNEVFLLLLHPREKSFHPVSLSCNQKITPSYLNLVEIGSNDSGSHLNGRPSEPVKALTHRTRCEFATISLRICVALS